MKMHKAIITIIILFIFAPITISQAAQSSNTAGNNIVIDLDHVVALKDMNVTIEFSLASGESVQTINRTLSVPSGGIIRGSAIFDMPREMPVQWWVRVINENVVVLYLEGVADLKHAVFTMTYYNSSLVSIPTSPSILTIAIARIEGIISVVVNVSRADALYNVSIYLDSDLSGNYTKDKIGIYSVKPLNGTIIVLHRVNASALKAPFKITITSMNQTILSLSGIIDWSTGSAIQLEGWRNDSVIRSLKITINYIINGSIMRMPNEEIIHRSVAPSSEEMGRKSIVISIGEPENLSIASKLSSSNSNSSPVSTPTTSSGGEGPKENIIDKINEILKNYWPFLALFLGIAIVLAVVRR